MTINPPPLHRMAPLTNITPFTYQDGWTYLQVLDRIRRYLTENLTPEFAKALEDTYNDFQSAMDEYHAGMTLNVEEFNRLFTEYVANVESRFADYINNVESRFDELAQPAAEKAVDEYLADPETLDAANGRLFDNPDSVTLNRSTRAAVDVLSKYGGAVSVIEFGAVPDWNGSSGTDSGPAINAAISAVGEGGTVIIPPGRFYVGETIIIEKSINLTCGAGGDGVSGGTGTQLVFAPGVTGIKVEKGADTPRPSKWRIGPLFLRSMSVEAGSDVGIFVSAGRGLIEGVSVERFGSHGIHLLAGVGYGPGNANLVTMILPRAYGNRGDGIRLEGSDANACLLLKPDVVANHGWGINLERTAMTKIIGPHADQSYNNSPGAYRDNGNSNSWDWVYSEQGGEFRVGPNASNGSLEMSQYARPPIVSDTAGAMTTYHVQGLPGNATNYLAFRHSTDETQRWKFSLSQTAAGSFDFTNMELNQRVFTVNAGVTTTTLSTTLRPGSDGTHDIGATSARWKAYYGNTIDAKDEIRVGTIRLRDNGGTLEKSTNGTTWSEV